MPRTGSGKNLHRVLREHMVYGRIMHNRAMGT
jgi:hypothetical protein